MLSLFELGLRRCPDLDHCHTTRQLGQPLLQLLLVVVRRAYVYLRPDLLDPPLDGFGVALALNDGRVVLVGDNPPGPAQVLQGYRVELPADLLRDDSASGENCNVLKHGLSPVAKARCLDCKGRKSAPQLVYHQRGQRLALNVFCDDDQVLGHLDDLLQSRQYLVYGGDLLVGNQDVRIFQFRPHLLGVGDEVRANVAAVELHSFDELGFELQPLALFYGDDTVLTDLLHDIRDQIADLLIDG